MFQPPEVAAIRKAVANGESGAAIARRLGVHRATVSKIARGRTYQTVGGQPCAGRHLTPEEVRTIRDRAARGETATAIADDMGLIRQSVSRVILGRSYRDAGGPIAEPRVRPGEARRATILACALVERRAQYFTPATIAGPLGCTPRQARDRLARLREEGAIRAHPVDPNARILTADGWSECARILARHNPEREGTPA